MTTTRNCSVPVARYRSVPFSALFGDANQIQNEINRLFEGPSTKGPAINLWSDENAFHLETDVPGIDPATLEITVSEGTELTIKGERQMPEQDGVEWLRRERTAGTFTRTVTLPTPVNADAVDARCEHGVLKLTLPKSDAVKPRRIAVKS